VESNAEQNATAERLYRDAVSGWFPQFGNQQTNLSSDHIPPSVRQNYSLLAKEHDGDQNQLGVLTHQIDALNQPPADVPAPAQTTAKTQPADATPTIVNPAQYENVYLHAQDDQIQNDFDIVRRAAGKTSLYHSDIDDQLTKSKDPTVQQAAKELEELYTEGPSVKNRAGGVMHFYNSDYQDNQNLMTQDQINWMRTQHQTPIDDINKTYMKLSADFTLLSQTEGKTTLSNDDLQALTKNNNGRGAISDAAWDLIHFKSLPNGDLTPEDLTQQTIDSKSAADLRGHRLSQIQPNSSTLASVASGGDGTISQTQPPNVGNNTNGQTQSQIDAAAAQALTKQQLSDAQVALTKRTLDEQVALSVNSQVDQNSGRVISGGGYYQVAERLLGITDLRKRPTTAQAKELNLLTGILEQEASKSNNNNGVPRHLKAGQSLLSADNIRDAMDQLDAIIEATRTARPTPPAAPAVNA
jgi:hypothetical protein